ncbi:MAG: VWA domain-containing protein [Chloroflexi bacterium]|nr:VWA domain-containing protein [Chloroflexota bacterium]
MPVGVELTQPAWLLALPVAVIVLVLARWPWWQLATDHEAGRRQRRRSEGWRLGRRLLWIAVLTFALAGATLTRPLDRQAIVFVMDSSASVAPVRDEAESAIQTALTELRSVDMAGVVATAAGAQIEERPSDQPLFQRVSAALPDSATDLSTGLRLAAAVLPSGYAGRVVLLSDGRETRGDVVSAARELSARGITVDVLPVGASPRADVRLDAVALAETAHEGEVATLTAAISVVGPEGTGGQATIRVSRDDAHVLERSVTLRSGKQEVALPVPVGPPGLHRYRIDVIPADAAANETTRNDALGAIQRVVGPPRVLVVATGLAEAGLLPGALEAGGAAFDVVQPAQVPADSAGWARYDAVVLANVGAEELPPGAMELLEQQVRDLGRGLAMTGGPTSFGPGGYDQTPVERALPVEMDITGRGREPKVAMALVIDKSGSMSGLKVEMAKEAALRSVGLLRPGDRAAVLAFDSVPQWVSPLTPIDQRDEIERAIGSVYAAGGTEIYPALEASFSALRDAPADVKHVILLTDGRSGSTGDYGALLDQLNEARVTLSTVAVGEDADTGLLRALARNGRGRYHFASDPTAIPRIFSEETVTATRSILVEAHFFPAAASRGPLLQGLGSVPPLDGYVTVAPKETAEVVLVSPEGDPVLAAWQYGAGRAVAWTPDLTTRWAGGWTGSSAATALWGNVLSWLLPPPDAGELQVRVEADGAGGFAIVAENRSEWDQVRPTEAAAIGPDGTRQSIPLAPVGPGRYRGALDEATPGAYVVQVTQAVGDAGELRGEAGWVAPYSPEYRESGTDQALLGRIVAAGGGRLLGDPTAAVALADRPALARWPAWPLLLILAALTWPLEIAARRLGIPAPARWWPQLRPGTEPSAEPTSPASPLPGPIRRRPTSPVPTPASAAASTAQRLLERKRALRDGPS